MKLLTRDAFREGVFARDNHKCVVCGEPAKDAHHIIERRLFDDGGYYLDNGASLCEKHHIAAERTTLSCDEIRELCGIDTVIPPPHLYADNDYGYDKWGNIVLKNGNRIKGELFFDESVQKILDAGNVLDLFVPYVKYPRTMHVPWSEKLGKDDRRMSGVPWDGMDVIVTLKMDGENTSMYRDHIHARSLDSGSHPSRNWVKGLWSRISYEIPEGWRICGENMFAVHTITYDDLESYFLMFSMWNDRNVCLSWDETMEYAQLLGLNHVPVLYRGVYDEKLIREEFKKKYPTHEGYVIRPAGEFKFSDFRKVVGKFVDGSFKIKHGHWTQQKMEANRTK